MLAGDSPPRLAADNVLAGAAGSFHYRGHRTIMIIGKYMYFVLIDKYQELNGLHIL